MWGLGDWGEQVKFKVQLPGLASGKGWDMQASQGPPCPQAKGTAVTSFPLTCPCILSPPVAECGTGDCHYHSSQLWPPTEGAPGPPHKWKAADAAPSGVPQQRGHGARPNTETPRSDHGDRVVKSPSRMLADNGLVLSCPSWVYKAALSMVVRSPQHPHSTQETFHRIGSLESEKSCSPEIVRGQQVLLCLIHPGNALSFY